MKITDKTIEILEGIFQLKFYEWQKSYLKDESNFIPLRDRSGKTFVYCIKLLLSDGPSISKQDIIKFVDYGSDNGTKSRIWFKQYCLQINHTLVTNGFQTRIE